MADEDTIRKFLIEIGYKEDAAARSRAADSITGMTSLIAKLGTVAAAAYGVDKFIQFNKNLANTAAMADRIGSTVQQLRNLGEAASISGSSVDGMKAAVEGFSNFVKQNPAADTWLKGFVPSLDIVRDKVTGLLKNSKGEVVDTLDVMRKFIEQINNDPRFDIATKLNIAKQVGVSNTEYFALLRKETSDLFERLKEVDKTFLGDPQKYIDNARKFSAELTVLTHTFSDLYTMTLGGGSGQLVGPLKELNEYLQQNGDSIVHGIDAIGTAFINVTKAVAQTVAILGDLTNKDSPAFGYGTVGGPFGKLADYLEDKQRAKEGVDKPTQQHTDQKQLPDLAIDAKKDDATAKEKENTDSTQKNTQAIDRQTSLLQRLENWFSSTFNAYQSKTVEDLINRATGGGGGEEGSSGGGQGAGINEGSTGHGGVAGGFGRTPGRGSGGGSGPSGGGDITPAAPKVAKGHGGVAGGFGRTPGRGSGGGSGPSGGGDITPAAPKVAKGQLSKNQQEAYQAARDLGYSDAAARAMTANFSGESLGNPANKHWDVHHYSQGIAQWDDFRSNRIFKQFGKYPKDMSIKEQVAAFKWETDNYFPSVAKALKNPQNSPENMVRTLVYDFEKPAAPGKDTSIRQGLLHGLRVKQNNVDAYSPKEAPKPASDKQSNLQTTQHLSLDVAGSRPIGDNISHYNTSNDNSRKMNANFGPFHTHVHMEPGGKQPSASAIGLSVESGMRRHAAAIRDQIAPMVG